MSQSRPTDAEATAYAENYVLYGDQSRAFRNAFPASKASAKAINEKASVFHRIKKVQQRVEELRPVIAEEAAVRFKIDAHYVMRRLTEIDQMDAADILDANGEVLPIHVWPKVWRQYISGFDVMEVSQGGDRAAAVVKKIKWPDKTKNLEMIGRLAEVGAFKDRVEHSGQIGMTIAADEDDL